MLVSPAYFLWEGFITGKKYAIHYIDLIAANEREFEFLLAKAIGKSDKTLYLSEWFVLFMNPCWVKIRKMRKKLTSKQC